MFEPPVDRPPTEWEHYELWKGVRNALFALPDYFNSPTTIEGLLASDIFTLNTPLSATIEEFVVDTLNSLRSVWDPDGRYQTFSFVRQSQTFPDVLLRETSNGINPLMGIELKGWYLLAKEKHPSYRFTVTPAACNPWDLLVVVPWVLSNVLAGTPVLFRPFVASALYCAEKRNFYWQNERTTQLSVDITSPKDVEPYPSTKDAIADVAASDSGGNFGRLARYRIMDDYLDAMLAERIRGVGAAEWIDFFTRHAHEARE